jgi:lysophospholipid acyltransferase (LPLAT)-like uncharacterized protein
MKFRHPGLLRGLGFLGAWLIRGLVSTLQCRMDLVACGPQPTDPRRQRFIYAFWHETMLFATQFPTRVHALISQHADGELIAQVCRNLRIGVVRGSSRRGGTEALLALLEVAQKSHLAITPDGPRGPRRRVQPGVIFLAAKTGLPIVPFGVGYAQAWRAPSWDRFAVPYPFTMATCVGAAPIYVPAVLDLQGLEKYRRLLEQRLLVATEDAERWALGQPRRGQQPVLPLPQVA